MSDIYRKYPILNSLKNRKLNFFIDPNDMESNQNTFHEMKKIWSNNVDDFSKKIVIVPETTFSVMDGYYNEIRYINEISDIESDIQGTYLFDGLVVFVNTTSKYGNILYLFHAKYNILLGYRYGHFKSANTYISPSLRKSYSEEYNTLYEDVNPHHVLRMYCYSSCDIRSILSIEAFMRVCYTETVQVNNDHKKQSSITNNEIKDFPLIRLDSTWYTSIIRTEKFQVRSHIRMQPKKINGRWVKEPVQIPSYVKNGYTRKARKLQ